MTIDFDGVEQPPGPRPRRRIVAGVGAAMLVAAAGGVGFGIGVNVDRDPEPADQLSSGADDATQQIPDTTAPPPVDDDRAREPAPEPAAESAAEPADGRAESAPTSDLELASSSSVYTPGGPGYAANGSGSFEPLFDRVTDTGLTVRAQLGQRWFTDFADAEPDVWQAPSWCFQSGEARISLAGGEATGPSVIDVGSVAWFDEPYLGRSVSWVTLGRADDNPHRVVFVQVPQSATNVMVDFADGSTDTVTPQNGVAVLVVPGAPETIVHEETGPNGEDYGSWTEEVPDFAVTIANGDADTGADVVVDDAQVGTWNDPDFAASCSPPPPALPEPGEQPADPAAAEDAIVAAMDSLYGQAADGSSLDVLDDATGVAEAREMVAAGGFENEAASAVAIVEELVFTQPGEAWFRYRVETAGIGLGDRFGMAVEIDGVWKITRATICQDLSMAGGVCEPFVEPIFPPGSGYGFPTIAPPLTVSPPTTAVVIDE